jgi:peptide/nickel transport system permease protein
MSPTAPPKNPLLATPEARIGAAILLFFCALALFGPFLVGDPTAFVGVPHSPPSSDHLFGTTGQGQDVLAQTVCGARVTLGIGLVVGLASVALGALIGVTAGYFGGRIDDFISLFINVFLVLPGLPLAIVVAAYLPSGPVTLASVLVLTGWAWNARVIRSAALALRRRDFIAAAIVSGESSLRILVFQMLPNLGSLLISQVIGATTYALGAQVGLEFLGLGDASSVTWGTNLYWAANDAALLTGSYWTFLPTGLCIALVGVALTLLNGAVDTFTNPRLIAERHWRKTLTASGHVVRGPNTPVARDDR